MMSKSWSALTLVFLFFQTACLESKKASSEESIRASYDRLPAVAVSSPSAQTMRTPTKRDSMRSRWVHCASVTEEHSSIKITPHDILVPFADAEAPVRVLAKVENRIAFGINPDAKGKRVAIKIGSEFTVSGETGAEGMLDLAVKVKLPPMSATCFSAEVESTKMFASVFSVDRDQPMFITDIDEVISDLPEYKVPLMSIEKSPALPDSVKVLVGLSHKNLILYLSARDDALMNKTRSWLAAKSFPAGPVFVWNWTLANGLGASSQKQFAYKTDFILGLKKKFPNIIGGIGNRVHDSKAYLAAGIKSFIINPKENKSKFPAGTIFVGSWNDVPGYLKQ